MIWITGIGMDGLDYRYFTERNRFPMKVSWCPGNEAFPLDLFREEKRVRPLVAATKSEKGEMSLVLVRIGRITPLNSNLKNSTLTVQDFTNQWFIVFMWEVKGPKSDGKPPRHNQAVVLLDGTLATERLSSHQVNKVRDITSSVIPVSSSQSDAKAASDWRAFDQMLEERKKMLRCVNLAAGSASAIKYLTERVPNSWSLSLEEVHLFFKPVSSNASRSLAEAASKFDWVATFSFAEPTARSLWYDVDTLSDGTILASRSKSRVVDQ
jgi:hypothetical protein